MPKIACRPGDKFGSLLVKSREGIDSDNKTALWKVECDCGNILLRPTDYLRFSKVKTCHECEVKRRRGGTELISGDMFYSYRHDAERRNISFNISLPQISELLVEQEFKCVLSGLELKTFPYSEECFRATNASLDRKNSDLNYDIENLQWLDKRVNKMKNDFIQDEFIEYCDRVTKYFNKGVDFWVESNGAFI
jgi:hypothetical protein